MCLVTGIYHGDTLITSHDNERARIELVPIPMTANEEDHRHSTVINEERRRYVEAENLVREGMALYQRRDDPTASQKFSLALRLLMEALDLVIEARGMDHPYHDLASDRQGETVVTTNGTIVTTEPATTAIHFDASTDTDAFNQDEQKESMCTRLSAITLTYLSLLSLRRGEEETARQLFEMSLTLCPSLSEAADPPVV